MKRILHNTLTVLSLLFAIIAATMWVRSYWPGDYLYHGEVAAPIYYYPANYYGVVSYQGALQFETFSDSIPFFPETSRKSGHWTWGHANASELDMMREVFGDGGWPNAKIYGGLNTPEKSILGLGYGADIFRHDGARFPPPDAINHFVIIPYWLIVLALSAAPVALAISFIRHRRRFRSGLCPTCGYDLRASPTRCPECGTPAPASIT